MYNIKIEKLVNKLDLGENILLLKEISGGLLHRMFCVETTRGKFAIKALNPEVMQRNGVFEHYKLSEKISVLSRENGVKAICANVYNNEIIHNIEGQYYMVFPWVDGKIQMKEELNKARSAKIGEILAKIHLMNTEKIRVKDVNKIKTLNIDWIYYTEKAQKINKIWKNILNDNLDFLKDISELVNQANGVLYNNRCLSHRDLDKKNVIWNRNEPMLIDWEAGGLINPTVELLEVALYWSEGSEYKHSKECFNNFICSYSDSGGRIEPYFKEALFGILRGKLEWLEYNLKRALSIDVIGDENLGIQEVISTIIEIKNFYNEIPKILGWLTCC